MRRLLVAGLIAGCGAFAAADEEPGAPSSPSGDAGAEAAIGDGASAGEGGALPEGALAAKEVDVSSIAVDETSVYWATRRIGGHVATCPKSGCPASGPTVLASSQNDAHKVAIADGRIAWLADDRLRSVPIGGGEVFETTDGFNDAPPSGYVILGPAAYVADGLRVRRCNNPFTTRCIASQTTAYPLFSTAIADLHRGGADLFGWTTTGVIRRMITATFGWNEIGGDTAGFDVLTVDSEIFFVNHAGLLRAVALTGGAPRDIQGALPAIVAIAVDSTNVFMVSEVAGKVLRVPRAGGDLVELKTGLVTPRAIALDADAAWVAVAGTGDILRLPK